jgi:glycerol uptake facilitator-like aquaporin
MILIILTCGISAEETLQIGPHKSWLTSSLGSGLAVLVAVCVAGHVSVSLKCHLKIIHLELFFFK